MWWRRKPAPLPPVDELHARVAEIIDSFRPFIRADGGEIDFVGIQSGIVRVRLRGACAGCPSSFMTLQMGIERTLRERIPQVRAVENVG